MATENQKSEETESYRPPEGYETARDVAGKPLMVSNLPVLEDDNGTKLVDVGGTLVKYYPTVRNNDPNGMIRVAESLAYRFFRDAETGINVRDRIEERKQVFEEENDPIRKRAAAGLYVGAMFNEMVELLKEDIGLVGGSGKGVEARRKEITAKSSTYFMAINRLINNVQLRIDGSRDFDGVLGKEIGEAPKALMIVMSALERGEEEGASMDNLYAGRYREVALAKEEIAEMGNMMKLIIEERPETKEAMKINDPEIGSPLRVIDELVLSAQALVELKRDDPGYDEMHINFDVAQNNLRVASQPGQKVDLGVKIALKHVERGREEIGDMVMFRMGRPNRVNGFIAVLEIGRACMFIRKLLEREGIGKNPLEDLLPYADAAKDMVFERYRDTRGHPYSEDDPDVRQFMKENFGRESQRLQEFRDRIPQHLRTNNKPGAKIYDFIGKVMEYVDMVHSEIKDSLEQSTGTTINVGKIRKRREKIKYHIEDLRLEYSHIEKEISPKGRSL